MSKTYYTLAEWDPMSKMWTPQWGSYVKAEVVEERNLAYHGIPRKYLKIVASGNDGQHQINEAIKALPAPKG